MRIVSATLVYLVLILVATTPLQGVVSFLAGILIISQLICISAAIWALVYPDSKTCKEITKPLSGAAISNTELFVDLLGVSTLMYIIAPWIFTVFILRVVLSILIEHLSQKEN